MSYQVICVHGLLSLTWFVGTLSGESLTTSTIVEQKEAELFTPTHVEVKPLKFKIGPNRKIDTMAMTPKGELLVCVSWTEKGVPREKFDPRKKNYFLDSQPRTYALKWIEPQTGNVLKTLTMKKVAPKMIHCCEDGTIYVGGKGHIAKLDSAGKILELIKVKDLFDGNYDDAHISGITANKKYVFIALGHGFSLRAVEDIARFDRDLKAAKIIVKRQFGCCSHLDLDTNNNELLIAENSRFRVNRYTFEGELLGRWGRRNRKSISGFAACCNPVNFDFGSRGVLYTAESGVGRIKKYSDAGKFLGVVGYVDTTKFDRGSWLAAQSCYIPIEVGKNDDRIYIMDVRAHIIRVLEKKKS